MEVVVVRLCFLFGLINLCRSDLYSKNNLTTDEMIVESGFPAETHKVYTEDGFILTLHRIPGNKTSGFDNLLLPVLIQHGLFHSSATWVLRGPQNSLAFSLASKGYDVWLGNARGNMYANKHSTLNSNEDAFWDWSWHEIGFYDMPAIVGHILRMTGHSKLTYIGYSMGTTAFFVMCSMRPEYNKNIDQMIALAPVAFMTHSTSPIRYLTPFAKNFQYLSYLLGKRQFSPRSNSLSNFLKGACRMFHFQATTCDSNFLSMSGYDPDQFESELVQMIEGHPGASSTKVLAHYAQEIESSKFHQFDYGEIENLKIYKSSTPPEYNLTKITVPVSLHYADNDLLAQPKDVMHLYKRISNKLGLFRVNYTQFTHMDFMYARDVKVLVFDRLEKLISSKDYFKDLHLPNEFEDSDDNDSKTVANNIDIQ